MKIVFNIIFTSLLAVGTYCGLNKVKETPVAVSGINTNSRILAASNVTTQEIIDLANTFKSTLTSSQLSTLQLSYTLSNAETWSNLPAAMSARIGLKMGSLSTTQLAAARNLIAALSGTGNEGYTEIYGLWMADNYLSSNGGGTTYGEGNFYIGFFGTPSLSGTFEIQMTGHHRTVSNTYINGVLVGATPSFVAVEPFASFTQSGSTYQPMIEEQTTLAAMLAGLSTTQKASAKLSTTFTDLVCGPGHDWSFPTTKSGLQCNALDDAQKQLVMDAIATYVNDVDDANAATILALYGSELDDTYIAWSYDATLTLKNGYVRIDGPHVWIEYSVQNGIILTPTHPHSIWRDHVTDYGGTGYVAATNEVTDTSLKVLQYPNPVSDITTFNFNLVNGGSATIAIYDISGKLLRTVSKTDLSAGNNSVSLNLGDLESGNYIYKISSNGLQSRGGKFVKI